MQVGAVASVWTGSFPVHTSILCDFEMEAGRGLFAVTGKVELVEVEANWALIRFEGSMPKVRKYC